MAAAGVGVKDTVVLYPAALMGHLVPMVELGKFFLSHGLAVAVIVTDPPHNTGGTAPFIARVSAELPSMSFHRLPPVSLPPISSRTPEATSLDFLLLSSPNLAQPLTSISQTSNIRAIVLDTFCTDALDVVADFGFPTYFYFTSSASALAVALHLPVLCNQITASFKDMGDTLLPFPGLPPIPASHMVHPMLDRENEVFNAFIYHFARLPRADGIIVNTFEALETRVLRAIADGLCVPGRQVPPIYCVGPMVREGQENEKHECLEWLDLQPQESVVFLCFGSLGLGLFSAEQITEIATGLERSGQRFLWVVRSPPSDDPAKRFLAPPEPDPDLDALLPEGFLDRTKKRGFVVKSWAPQMAVLRHGAVGGFVTHCGWNSVLESITAGVPMVAWPLYAEQRMNKVLLVEDMKLAVEMKGYDKGLVQAAEVEARVRWVIESEGGKELRERTAAAKESAMAAVTEGGTSNAAGMALVAKWKGGTK